MVCGIQDITRDSRVIYLSINKYHPQLGGLGRTKRNVMTMVEKMKAILWGSGLFLQSEIEQIFSDAELGKRMRWSDEDDEEKEEEKEDEDEDTTIDRELMLFLAQREAFERAEDDGRCLRCEGWGCDTCQHTGGY